MQALSNCIAPGSENHFKIKIDNSQNSSGITAVRLALTRTTRVGSAKDSHHLKVKQEEIANATHSGGQPGEKMSFELTLKSPVEITEKYPFNYDDGSTVQYGSMLAPSYSGKLVEVDYNYVLRIWHRATIGSDTVSEMPIPVTVVCPSPNFILPKVPKRRNSGSMMRN